MRKGGIRVWVEGEGGSGGGGERAEGVGGWGVASVVEGGSVEVVKGRCREGMLVGG